MKILIFILLILPSTSFADGFSILTREPGTSEAEVKSKAPEIIIKDNAKTTKRRVASVSQAESLNLPTEYRRPLGAFEIGARAVYTAKNNLPLSGLVTGMTFRAVIDKALTVSQNVMNPVSAVIVSGKYKGALVSGDAELDKDLKRVLINFTDITLRDNHEVYAFKGKALGENGVGVEGSYHNQSAKFFLAEFASAAVAGYLDSGVSRSQTIQGNYVTEPSASNAAKSGAVAALSKSTERFAEEARGASDYTHTKPFIEIDVIVKEDPHLKQN